MDDYVEWSDNDLIEEINDRCCARNDWEIEFIESVVSNSGRLFPKQKEKIIQILRRDDG